VTLGEGDPAAIARPRRHVLHVLRFEVVCDQIQFQRLWTKVANLRHCRRLRAPNVTLNFPGRQGQAVRRKLVSSYIIELAEDHKIMVLTPTSGLL
jgi:hypothetical protein